MKQNPKRASPIREVFSRASSLGLGMGTRRRLRTAALAPRRSRAKVPPEAQGLEEGRRQDGGPHPGQGLRQAHHAARPGVAPLLQHGGQGGGEGGPVEAGEGPREGGDQVEGPDLEATQEVEQKEEAGGQPPAEVRDQHGPLPGVGVHQNAYTTAPGRRGRGKCPCPRPLPPPKPLPPPGSPGACGRRRRRACWPNPRSGRGRPAGAPRPPPSPPRVPRSAYPPPGWGRFPKTPGAWP